MAKYLQVGIFDKESDICLLEFICNRQETPDGFKEVMVNLISNFNYDIDRLDIMCSEITLMDRNPIEGRTVDNLREIIDIFSEKLKDYYLNK